MDMDMRKDMDAVVPGFIRSVEDSAVVSARANSWIADELYSYPPERLDRVGDLVVAGGELSWFNPEHTRQGGFVHRVPDGTYPVYAAGVLLDHYVDAPARHCVELLFIPLVAADRLTAPRWSWGYNGVAQQLEDYACLMSERACRVTREDPQHEAIVRAREAVLSDGARTRSDNRSDEVVDPETGANVLTFPVEGGRVCGFEARDEADELLAVLLICQPD